MANKIAPCLVVLFMFCAAQFSLAQTIVAEPQYRFQHFGTQDGLPAESIQSMAQDSLGFIWFSYYGSLSRFDGYSFKTYKHDPNDSLNSLPQGVVRGMWTDPYGDIWVLVFNADTPTIAKYDIKTDGFIKYAKPDFGGCIVDRTDPTINWCVRPQEKGLFRYNSKTTETIKYVNDQADSLIEERSNSITDIMDHDSILLISSWEGLWRFNKKSKIFSRPPCNPADSALFYHTTFQYIEGPKPNVDYREFWIWDNQKMLKVDHSLTIVKRFDFPQEFRPADFARDKEGICWFTSWYPQYRGGLYRYDPRDDSFVVIKSIPGDESSLRNNNLVWVRVDKDQNIWTGGSAHGVSRLQKKALPFYNFKFPSIIGATTVYHSRESDFIVVGRVKKFGYGEGIWSQLEILMAPIIHDRLDSLKFKSIAEISGSRVLSFFQGRNNFWISAVGSEMVSLPIDLESGMIHSPDPRNRKKVASQSGVMWEDQDENFWFAKFDGLHKVSLTALQGTNASDKHYTHVDNDPNSISSNGIYGIVPNTRESFFVVTPCCVDLFHNESFEHVFSGHLPTCVHVATDSTLFVGTFDGLFEGRRLNGQYKFIRNPLPLNDVLRMQEDKLGRLWISKPKGIVCYDRHQQFAIEFNERNGFHHYRDVQNVHRRESQTSRGFMVLSDEDGISIFDPLKLEINKAKTFPVITNLKINNQVAMIHGGVSKPDEFSIKENVSVLEELILDYRHNNFSIEFSAMEMTSPEKNLYRYMLEGFDKDWIETDYKNRAAAYTNLDAGSYTFKVKASNHHGIWSDQEKTLRVRILPPPWKTWWAYTGYSLIVAGLLFGARRMIVQRERLKANLDLAKVEKEKEHFELEKAKEVDQLKSRFFANISHEFRTPITLVLGPLKDHYKQLSNPEQKNMIGSVIRNGQRLQRLINQLLDLSKVEAGKMKLHTSYIDLIELLRELVASYESLAKEKNIRYFFYPEVKELMVYVDLEKMEKIMHNLLSNAFKFTQEGGEVILNLRAAEKSVLISVSDSGIGIPKDQLDKIFDRFYQVDSSQTRSYEGSGLGLALVKDLVELHHGKISVDSKEGKGTTFTVSLPLGKEHLQNEEIVEHGVFEKMEVLLDYVSSNGGNGREKESTKEKETVLENPVVLIVEDNADMRQYIRKTLSAHYQIVEAENGREGLDKAKETMPDLIISDLMMPEMDGYKLCSMIKSKELTSHIPVILINSKSRSRKQTIGLGNRSG